MRSISLLTVLLLLGTLYPMAQISSDQTHSPVTWPETIKVAFEDDRRPKLKVEVVKIIQLETSANCMIGSVSKVEYYKNRIYLLNMNRFENPTLYAFDDDGCFVNKTIIGKGPGEVIEPFAFTINKEKDVIILYDQAATSTYLFDLDLKFLKKQEHDRIMEIDMEHISADTILSYEHAWNRSFKSGRQFFTHSLYTDHFKKKHQLDIVLNGDKIPAVYSKCISVNKGKTLFFTPCSYNIYQLVGSSHQVRYQIDFGKKAFSEKELTKPDMELWEQRSTGSKLSGISGIHQTDEFLGFKAHLNRTGYFFLRSWTDGQLFCLNDGIDESLWPMYDVRNTTEDGRFFSVVQAITVREVQEVSGEFQELEVGEEDNPVVVVFGVRR